MATIKVNRNGPYLIQGDVQMTDAEGNVIDVSERPAIALCRCGASANKPFCDGTHKTCGFQDDGTAKGA